MSLERKLQNQIASLAVQIRAMYSAFVVNKEIISYCFDDHEIAAPFKIKVYSDTAFLLSNDIPLALVQIQSPDIEFGLLQVSPQSQEPFKYYSTRFSAFQYIIPGLLRNCDRFPTMNTRFGYNPDESFNKFLIGEFFHFSSFFRSCGALILTELYKQIKRYRGQFALLYIELSQQRVDIGLLQQDEGMAFSIASHFYPKQPTDWSKQGNLKDVFYFFLNVID